MMAFNGAHTTVISIFDWYCNIVGYNDNVPIGRTTDIYSQLPYTVIVEPIDESNLVFLYAGGRYGYESSQIWCWQDPTPGYGFPNYCLVPFACPPR